MAKKIGVLLALDGEKEFTQGLKNAQTSAKGLKSDLSALASEYKGNANSLEYLTKRQEKLKEAQTAYERVLAQAKNGQRNALQNLNKQKDALEDLRKQLEKAEKAQKDMEDSGDRSSKAYKDQVKAVEDLREAVSDQNTEYLKAEGRMTSWDLKVSQAERSVRSNSKALDENGRYMREAETSADHCATSIDGLGKESKDAAKKTDDLGISLRTMIKAKAVDLAGDALRELGQKAVEAAKYVIEVGSSFEKAMSEVEAISGASGSELDAMSEKAQRLGASTKFSATEVAQGFKYMSLAGWETSDMLSGIDGIVSLAAASEMDLASASDMVTDYLSAFGMEAQESAKMADMLAYAQANSNTTVELLGESFGNCAANMNAAGQDIETTTSFLEAMANQGRKGAQAGTTLSAIMRDVTAKMEDGKIMIGDTAVSVQDANGNFRDMTDIMTDVEAATQGMGDAERAAALSATFTSRSISGVNMILNEGMGNIAGYEEKLRTADGAAATMASTMQDNLGGAITELGSATEGLGIALYEKVKGPLTKAVDIATGLISGITDALTPERTELEQFIADIEASNEHVQELLKNADSTVESGKAQVADLEAYKSVLLELNGITLSGGQLDQYQLYQAKNAVEALSGVMPELKENFDETTGSLGVTNEQLIEMFNNTEALVMQQALIDAQKESYEALAEAVITKAKADAAVKASTDELTAANERNEQSADYLTGGYGEFYSEVLDAEVALDKATAAQEDANSALEDAQAAIDETDAALKPLYDKYGILTEAQDDSASSAKSAAQAQKDLAEAQEDSGDSAEEAAKKQEEAAKAVEEAHKGAAQAIADAYSAAKQQAEGSFDIDPLGGGFDGGADKTVEQMSEAMQSQIEGMQNYAENLAIVKDHVGKEIAPEFMQYLIEMGEDGANALQHLAITFQEDDGPEKVKALSDQYVESLQMREGISDTLAQDATTLKLGLRQMGSTAREWSGLDAVISKIQHQGGQISDATLSSFNEAAENARSCGVKIPEGLAEGIESSSDAESALMNATEQLNAAVQGQAEGLLEVARQNGIEIPQSISDGIAQGGDAAVQAYNDMLALISSAGSGVEQAASDTGTSLTEGTASAISDNAGTVESAASSMASGAASAADGKASEFTTAGGNAGSQYASGISGKAGEASSAGASLASAAISAAAGYAGSAYSVGYSISAGVASGISSGASMAISAAASMASSALSAAKAALDIKSPSRKFRDMVGKQIGAGTMFGIRQSTPATVKAAENLANKTLLAATRWLTKYKKSHKVTLEDTAWFWEKMVNRTRKGTIAYDKVVEKWTNANIANLFGVSRTKTTGSGKNQKTVKKDAESFYGEIMSAAGAFLERIAVRENVSVKQEIDYWTKVKKQLKAGTQAYLEAAQKIKQLKDGIGTLDVADSLLENYQTYYDLSERAEMQYWDRVRKRYKAGTQDRIDADKKYLDAKQRYTERLKSIEDDYAEKIADVNKQLKDDIKDLNDAYKDALKERTDAIAGAFDIFDAFESESATGEELLFNMKSQAAGYTDWRKQLDQLAGRGVLSRELMSVLTEKGPEDSAAIHALNMLSDDQLKEYDKAYQTKMQQAAKQASEDTADLKKETAAQIKDLKVTAQSEIASLKAQRKAEIAEVKAGISDGLSNLASHVKAIAADQTAALVAAMKQGGSLKEGTASSVGSNVAKATLREVDADLTFGATAKKTDNIKAIITSGKSRSKKLTAAENKYYVTLGKYIVTHYGRQPSNAMYKKLAAALGVKVSDKITNAQKQKILNALKKKGYRSGTRRLDEDFAWMDEEGAGSEMLVRKTDGAILTRAKKGDAIIPADLTDNLFSWGRVAPEELLAKLERQQQALQAMVAQTVQAADIAALNQRLQMGYAVPAMASGDSEMRRVVTDMMELMSRFLPYLAKRQEVVLDSGKLVSGISDQMSNELAMRNRRRR